MADIKRVTFTRGARALSKYLRALGLFALGSLMFIGAFDVIGRYFFNRPIMGSLEVGKILLAAIVFFAWPYTYFEGRHVVVDLIYEHLPTRIQIVLDFFTSFLSLVVFSLITWQSAQIAITFWHANRIIPILHVPLYPFQAFVTIGAFALCLELVVKIYDLFLKTRKGA